jgi:hypothetical protein
MIITLGKQKALEDRIEKEFRKLTDAELAGDYEVVRVHRDNYEYYKAELQALKDAVKQSIKTGRL